MKELQSSKSPVPIQSASTGDEDSQPAGGGFLQQPFVQNVLPFITSLSVHAGILIFGLLVFGAVKLVNAPQMKIQTIIPDSSMPEQGLVGGVPNVGMGIDSLRPALQHEDPATEAKGFSDIKGPQADPVAAGATGAEATIFSVGQMPSIGNGKSKTSGGSSDGSGLLAPWGTPGGGGLGPKSPVFIEGGGNARRIVYLCDATGSMINKFATLKDELSKSIVSLRPIQSFDIVFFQGITIQTMAPSLLMATPEHKRKAGTYLEGVGAMDTTDPIPSMEFALKLKPQLLYFLTDAADFPDSTALLDAIKKYNPKNETKINTILFVENKAEHLKNADSEGLMKQIASDSGGTFRWVEMDTLP